MEHEEAGCAGGASTAGGSTCDACGKPGAPLRCAGCFRAVYCDAVCQRLHWRGGHKRACRAAAAAAHARNQPRLATITRDNRDGTVDIRYDNGDEKQRVARALVNVDKALVREAEMNAAAMLVATDGAGAEPMTSPPHPRPNSAPAPTARIPTAPAVPAGPGGTPGERRADGAAGGGGVSVVAEDGAAEPENPCPLCLGNEDDSGACGMCLACGQKYCGECNATGSVSAVGDRCPTCRAPFGVSAEEKVKRLLSLVHDRTPGRHTVDAQCSLGDRYLNGAGVEQDFAEAARWFRTAAEKGSTHAQHNLGCQYARGKGVGQDHAAAARWCRTAAEQGFAASQFNLAVAHKDGTGVGQDRAEAVRWYSKAAEQGYARAQFSLGLMHFEGYGTSPDVRQAAAWWHKAAAQGYPDAHTNLERLVHYSLATPGMPVVATGLGASQQGLPAQFNGRAGLVQGHAPRPGRLAVLLDGPGRHCFPGEIMVLLDGDDMPTSFFEANLRKADGF